MRVSYFSVIRDVTRTHPYAGNLTVCRRAFPGFAYREVEQGEQVEDIGEGSVQSVIIDPMVVSYLIEARH